MIYAESTNLIIYWDEEIECVQIEWKGFAYGEMFRDGMNKCLHLLRQKKAHRWLSDLRKARVRNQEDQAWMLNDWGPRSVLAGLKRVAIVVPESEFARMSMDKLMTKLESENSQQIQTSYYDDVAKAKEWLRTE